MTFVAFMFLAIPASAGMYYLPTANLGFMDVHTARTRHAHTIAIAGMRMRHAAPHERKRSPHEHRRAVKSA